MNFAGIIAEYDPFHNGHAWQLAQLRARGARYVAVVMSCSLTQRGSLPLLPEPVRVRAALQGGADLVLALPAPYACAGAEAFARAGVALLAAAGCDTLAFGAETPDTARLAAAAQVLRGEAYRAALKAQLAGGARSFAAARQAAAEAVCPGGSVSLLLNLPNNNLAVEYCKAIGEQNAPLEPLALPRQGAQHGQQAPAGGYASAGALRARWAAEGPEALAPYVPAAALTLYREAAAAGQAADPAAAQLALLALLRARCTGPAPFAGVRGASEGVEHRLAAAVRQAVSYPALLEALTTVRYPRARMRRLTVDAALGWQAGALPALPPYLHVLGARRAALPLLKGAALPVSASLAKLAAAGPACAACAAAQAQAADLAALCRAVPGPMGGIYRQKPVFLPDC